MVEAGGSYRPDTEDRLTEVLAAALRAHPNFLASFLTEIGAPSGEGTAVRTQEGFEGEPRLVDIVAHAFDARGEPTATVFIENKLDSWFSEQQAARQRRALNRLRPKPPCRLLVGIAEDRDLARCGPEASGVLSYDPRTAYDQVIGWTTVESIARSAGESFDAPWGGPHWQECASEPAAPGCQRVLHEFLIYLGEEALPGLTPDDVVAVERLDLAVEGVEALLSQAVAHVRGYKLQTDDENPVGDDLTAGEATCWVVEFQPPKDHWLTSMSGPTLDLLVAGREWEDARGATKPQIYAGLAFEVTRAQRDAAQAAVHWKAQAEAAGFQPFIGKEFVLAYRSKELRWITEQGQTIADQAEALGQWAVEAFDAACELPPPPMAKPTGRRGST
jgi:hypothetical protein